MKKTEPRYQCRHIFAAGNRCGSPTLRNEDFCYYHHNTHKPAPKNRPLAPLEFDLPIPEDRAAIQQTLAQVMRRIATNQIDPRRAGLLLYGLQLAASILPKPQKQAAKSIRSAQSRYEESRYEQDQYVDEIIDHPEHGPLALQSLMPNPEDLRPKSLAGELLRALRSREPLRELEDTDNNNQDNKEDDGAKDNNQIETTIPTLQAVADTSPNLTRINRRLCPKNHGGGSASGKIITSKRPQRILDQLRNHRLRLLHRQTDHAERYPLRFRLLLLATRVYIPAVATFDLANFSKAGHNSNATCISKVCSTCFLPEPYAPGPHPDPNPKPDTRIPNRPHRSRQVQTQPLA